MARSVSRRIERDIFEKKHGHRKVGWHKRNWISQKEMTYLAVAVYGEGASYVHTVAPGRGEVAQVRGADGSPKLFASLAGGALTARRTLARALFAELEKKAEKKPGLLKRLAGFFWPSEGDLIYPYTDASRG